MSALPRYSPEAECFFARYRRPGEAFWHELPESIRLIVWNAMLSARRDWDIQVLDEWRRAKPGRRWTTGFSGECVTHDVHVDPRNALTVCEHGFGLDEDAARHAAALAVLLTLDTETQKKLGNRP